MPRYLNLLILCLAHHPPPRPLLAPKAAKQACESTPLPRRETLVGVLTRRAGGRGRAERDGGVGEDQGGAAACRFVGVGCRLFGVCGEGGVDGGEGLASRAGVGRKAGVGRGHFECVVG
jgi:hypothetical protein